MIAAISSVVATGRRMNRRDGLILLAGEGQRRDESLRAAPPALPFVLPRLRLGRLRICRGRSALSGGGLRLALVLLGSGCSVLRIARFSQRYLGAVAEAIGSIDDNALARV